MIKKMRMMARFFNYMFLNKRYPFTLNLTIDYKCNLRCVYCNFWKLNHASMPKEKIFRIVDEAAPHCFYINLYGGEPLLRGDIGEIIDYIQRKEFIFLSITTNGTLVRQRIEDLKKVDLVVLSIDGPKSYNDRVRGRGDFDNVMEAIDLLKQNDVPILLNTTLCKENLKYVGYLMDLCMEKGIRISFNMYRKINDSELSFSKKEYKQALNKMMQYPDDIFPYKKEVYKRRYAEWPEWGEHKCTSGKDFCSINPDGQMFQCAITMEDYERKRIGGERTGYDNNVFEKGFIRSFNDLDLSNCLKCWTCDRTAVSLVMNNKIELASYILFFFKRKRFLKKNVLMGKRTKVKAL